MLWHRGYVAADTTASELDTVLDHFDAQLHVVGHTPRAGITTRYDGRLIDVNTVPFATEMLLLVRAADGYQRWRIRESGPPERLQ